MTGVCEYSPSVHAGKCTDTGRLSYRCQCVDGYTFANGQSCEPIEPCTADELNECHAQATCEHLGPGQALCTCKSGWMGPAGFGSNAGVCSNNGDAKSAAACELTGK